LRKRSRVMVLCGACCDAVVMVKREEEIGEGACEVANRGGVLASAIE
jgi:hypothetical protein